jgi:hypothetical protein
MFGWASVMRSCVIKLIGASSVLLAAAEMRAAGKGGLVCYGSRHRSSSVDSSVRNRSHSPRGRNGRRGDRASLPHPGRGRPISIQRCHALFPNAFDDLVGCSPNARPVRNLFVITHKNCSVSLRASSMHGDAGQCRANRFTENFTQ